MASKFLVIALVVMLVGSAFAMFDLNDADIENGYAVDDGYAADDGYAMDQLMDELHPMLAVKRDANRAKANKKYKSKQDKQKEKQKSKQKSKQKQSQQDKNRMKANKKYVLCHPVLGSTQECWCFKRSGAIFYCFGASNGK